MTRPKRHRWPADTTRSPYPWRRTAYTTTVVWLAAGPVCKNRAMVNRPQLGWARVSASLQRVLGRFRFVTLIVLCAMLTLCVVFSWMTRGAMAHLPFLRNGSTGAASSAQSGIVDLHPWQIAQALSPLAVSREEVEFAHEAERLADHDANQAFAVALRQAAAGHHTLAGEALALTNRVAQLQQTEKDDEAHARSLAAGNAADDDLKIAQAQVDLDKDELNDAEHDLARASGDTRSRIQQELAAHQAAISKGNAQAGNDSQVAVLSARQYSTLAGRIQAWMNQRSRYQLLQQARQQAQADAAAFTAQHNALETNVDGAQSTATAPAEARLAALQRKRDQRQLLSLYDDRIQTQGQLEGVYRKWASQVQLQHTIVLHMALRSLAMIACLLIAVIVTEAVGIRLLDRHALDRRRAQTLRTLLRLGIQSAGALCVLLITFGVPNQISTILGLTTAGLTVAMQSLILAFFGWFVLMGKNGMRVGDWVQINGVAGEVVEITLFRTTLLETSEWAEKGHPTGRRATFINNFAISGQFFNFSTAGQWMWDEMSLSLPSAADTYEKIAQINQAVLDETQQNAEAAEAEWKHTPQLNSLCQASAASTVHLRPAASGVDVQVRYVTRASQRIELRNRLYDRVLDVLHKRQTVAAPAPPSKLTAAVLAAGDGQDREGKPRRHSMYT